ncbi:hypothetical protein ACNAN0_04910 [Agrilactobacillus fermenti]|uniref:hypothetical protein n=1 Tax=Agrilactobacillus fermenti TaxID=2586909 RepID=UPI003A5BFA22
MATHNSDFYREAYQKIDAQLNPKNRKYFDQLSDYLVSAGITYDETQLYDLAQDLQQAEANGETAETYFGHDPKAMADGILANTKPTSKRDLWQLLGIIVIIMSAFVFINTLADAGPLKIEPLHYLLIDTFMVVFIWLVFQTFKHFAFVKKAHIIQYFALFCLAGLFILFYLLVTYKISAGIVWVLRPPLDLIIIGVILLGVIIFTLVTKSMTNRAIGLLIAFLITINGSSRVFYDGPIAAYLRVGYLAILGLFLIFEIVFGVHFLVQHYFKQAK